MRNISILLIGFIIACGNETPVRNPYKDLDSDIVEIADQDEELIESELCNIMKTFCGEKTIIQPAIIYECISEDNNLARPIETCGRKEFCGEDDNHAFCFENDSQVRCYGDALCINPDCSVIKYCNREYADCKNETCVKW